MQSVARNFMSLKFVLDGFNELINVIILLVLMPNDQKFLSTSMTSVRTIDQGDVYKWIKKR